MVSFFSTQESSDQGWSKNEGKGLITNKSENILYLGGNTEGEPDGVHPSAGIERFSQGILFNLKRVKKDNTGRSRIPKLRE